MEQKKSGAGGLPLPLISPGFIERRIYLIRRQKVMLDTDLAELYGVETKMLNRAVKRNRDRFPDDFMFQLSKEEAERLRFQIGTSSLRSQAVTLGASHGGRRYLPYAFTAQQEGSCNETQQAAFNSDAFVTIYGKIFPFLELALAQVAQLSDSIRVSSQILAKHFRFSPFTEILPA